tara:strand:+ start:1706 stop:2854 length:1149 start_codon:yes stop_codon:yes gene_type:complete
MNQLVTATMIEAGSAIRLHWHNGEQARFHALWLRDNMIDEETRRSANSQRLIKVTDIPEQIRIQEVTICEGDLRVTFSPQGQTAYFPASWLRNHIYDRSGIPKQVWVHPECNTWMSSFELAKVNSDYTRITTDRVELRDWLQAVRRFGVATLTNCPVRPGALLEIVKLFGYVRETNYGRFFNVRTEVSPDNLASSSLSLQGHTDNPYRDPVPTLQLLYCLESSAKGGDNLLVDGFYAAEQLHREEPDSFALLTSHCCRFHYSAKDNVKLNSRRPMIELAPDGELKCVRFNSRSIAPIVDVPFDRMLDYYRAYRKFSALVDRPSMSINFRLNPGDCFLVDNTRILHGRNAFNPSEGARWLQGCYADKDGLLSTLTALEQDTLS